MPQGTLLRTLQMTLTVSCPHATTTAIIIIIIIILARTVSCPRGVAHGRVAVPVRHPRRA
jgi:hypothetical protein